MRGSELQLWVSNGSLSYRFDEIPTEAPDLISSTPKLMKCFPGRLRSLQCRFSTYFSRWESESFKNSSWDSWISKHKKCLLYPVQQWYNLERSNWGYIYDHQSSGMGCLLQETVNKRPSSMFSFLKKKTLSWIALSEKNVILHFFHSWRKAWVRHFVTLFQIIFTSSQTPVLPWPSWTEELEMGCSIPAAS